MEKHRAVPQGYMLVGDIAKKVGVPVSTLHYYDKEGVLSPTSESEGGRRLYTHKDVVLLTQIQAMKYLGFSLKEIKVYLPTIDTSEEMSRVLIERAKAIRKKINTLKDSLDDIEKLNTEVLQMETVDWEKCADIVVLLQAKSDLYSAMKHFGSNVMDHIRDCFDKKKGEHILNAVKRLNNKVTELKKRKLSPESEQGQALAKEWWEMTLDFTDGDMSLLPELSKLGDIQIENEGADNFDMDVDFIDKAMRAYFATLGHNPFDAACNQGGEI